MPLLIFFSLVLAAGLAWIIYGRMRRSQRRKLIASPLPGEWVQILKDRVSLYPLLPEQLRGELHGRINIFLDEKVFIGCAGLEITDEIRLTIAGNACLLLLKRDRHYFTGFTSIMVYPDTYVAREVSYDGLIEQHTESSRAGESWHRGPVILSWADVQRGMRDNSDGHNVVLHEFAHKLDEENTGMDGLPILRSRTDYAEWAKVLKKEYETLLIRVDQGKRSVMDDYGAVSPPEFFAVATEAFFEKGRDMQEKQPELYAQLKRYYGLDPASWR